MKKNLLILIISFFLASNCLGFFGNKMAVEYDLISSSSTSIIKDDNGSIFEEVIYSSSEANFAENNLNFETDSIIIQRAIHQNLDKMYTQYLFKVNNHINDSLLTQDYELAERYQELLEEVTISIPEWQEYNLICKTQFKSKSAYCIFYDITETLFNDAEEVEHTFVTKYYYKTNSSTALNQGLNSIIVKTLQDLSITPTESITTYYSYLARSRRYHSNADSITQTEQGYLHSWNININEDEEIYFYLNIANRATWLIVAIILSLCLALALATIALIIVLIQKHKNKTVEEL